MIRPSDIDDAVWEVITAASSGDIASVRRLLDRDPGLSQNNNPAMVNFLLARGAPTNLADDEPWAKPLAWVTRRGHSGIVSILRAAGADSEVHP
jgi:hypothetical protein